MLQLPVHLPRADHPFLVVGMLEDSRPQVESSTPDIADGESRSEPEPTPVVKSDDEELKSEHEGSELGHSNPGEYPRTMY